MKGLGIGYGRMQSQQRWTQASGRMAILLTERLQMPQGGMANHTLSLTATERTRSRHWFQTDDGLKVGLQLPRGTVLRDGDYLRSQTGDVLVQVVAKPEAVCTVMATHSLDFLRAAYHLGNRHIPLEINQHYLRFSPDSVLEELVQQLGLTLRHEVAPFAPELGAYAAHTEHVHSHPS